MSVPHRLPPSPDELTLVELVNRVVDKGVVLSGDLTISVADVDLLHLDVRLMLCSADRVRRIREARSGAAYGARPPVDAASPEEEAS